MFLLHALALLTTKFFYTLTFLGFLQVFLLRPDCSSSVSFVGSPSNGNTRMLMIEKNLFTKSVTLFTKENVHLFYSSSDSALDLSSLGRRFLLWSLSWVLLTGISITSSVIASVTWNSQCLLIELCYCTRSYLKTHLHLFIWVSPHLVQCLSHSRHSIPLAEWIKEFRGITQLYILVSKARIQVRLEYCLSKNKSFMKKINGRNIHFPL